MGVSKRRHTRACLALIGAVTSALLIAPLPAHAEPGPGCAPPADDVMFAGEAGEPYASAATCENPDGSYTVCTPTGTAGDGPSNCTNYPAASALPPAEGASPPVPGAPPPPGQG